MSLFPHGLIVLLPIVLLLLFRIDLSSAKPKVWHQWKGADDFLEKQYQLGEIPSEDDDEQFPLYHFRMLNDKTRNDAFYLALQVELAGRKAARVPSKVLDLGAGAMLLSMIAARQGADMVLAIERNENLAKVGQRIITANGLLEKIVVVGAESFNVDAEDYPDILPADIFVSETLDSSLIGEGFISSLCDAKTRGLITPDATIIPARAAVWIQLVETTLSLPIPALLSGSDLNFELLREFRPISNIVGPYATNVAKELSAALRLFDFDFQNMTAVSDQSPPSWSREGRRDGLFDHTTRVITITNPGSFQAVAFWFDVALDFAGNYNLTNAPGSATHWDQLLEIVDFDERSFEVGSQVSLGFARIGERYSIVNRDEGVRHVLVHSHCASPVDIFMRGQHAFTLNGSGEYNLLKGTIGDKVEAVYKRRHDASSMREYRLIKSDSRHDGDVRRQHRTNETYGVDDLRVFEVCAEEKDDSMVRRDRQQDMEIREEQEEEESSSSCAAGAGGRDS